MKKRKKRKVKVYYKNIFILLIVILIGIFGVKELYVFLNDDTNINIDSNNSNKVNNEEENHEENIKEDNNIFSKEKYYHKENLDRYNNLKNNSSYSISEIIMRVNTSIDKEFYSSIKETPNPSDTLVLVNKYYKLPSGYEPDDLITTSNNKSSVKMRKEASSALESMSNAMWDDDIKILLQSGYRSEDTQEYLYNNYVKSDGKEEADTYSARPGHSEHQTGLAIDLTMDGTLEETFEDTLAFTWLTKNAHKYGFILRYPKDKVYMTGYMYEPWHYRYVGVEVATIIKNENLTFEEYLVKYENLY